MKTRIEFKTVKCNKGFVLILAPFLLVLFCVMAGFAIDASNAYVAKGQLQNAADAAALAGAGTIYPNVTIPLTTFPPPDFTNAESIATDFVKKNKAAGAYLTETDIVSIQTGYYNLSQNKQDPPIIQSTSITPTGKCSTSGTMCTSYTGCSATDNCLIQDVPAVLVTVRKSVPTFFAKIFGMHAFSPTVTAVAVRGYPQGGQNPFPVAVTKCMTDYYFSQSPLPNPPTTIAIWGPYGPAVPGCDTGQWTSLKLDSNDVPTIKKLMDGTLTSPPLSIGDDIWIQPGTKDALYQEIEKYYIGEIVTMPVVNDAAVSTHSDVPITGFISFQIDGVVSSGSNKQILGHFLAYYTDKNATTPGGAKGNTVTPPVLVR